VEGAMFTLHVCLTFKNLKTMGHKVEIVQSHEFSTENINDLICTALEGGINYWCSSAEIVKDKPTKTFVGVSAEDQTNVHYASDVIGYGGKLTLTDAEDPDETWELDLPKMLKGIKRYCEDRNESLSDLMDNHDAETADCIVQYALFDEIVYG
jgi:hypothetical protein